MNHMLKTGSVARRLLAPGRDVHSGRQDVSGTGAATREAGFTLMELLIVISIMLILMLIAIPNFTRIKGQANETSAKQSLNAIYDAEVQYSSDYPANGFACSLTALGGQVGSAPPTPQSAQLLDNALAAGQKSGYTFNITNCSKVTVNNQDQVTGFTVTAVPQAIGKTGTKGYCIDQAREIKVDPTGGTNCSQPLQ
ncbi:MAG TPA: type II secretion system protein [Acidisarcina sp.]